MTKKEIVRLVSEKLELSQQQTKEIVQKTFESIIEVLVKDGRIELRNFGVFEVKLRAARNARNPRTGVEVWVDEHETVAFKPGKMMVQKVQRERKKKNAKKAAAKKAAPKAAAKAAPKAASKAAAKKGAKKGK
ncbi:MAG: integration host factor subunit beta [Thermoguttaceae bacterium]|nr:integration host factor subunit beta [Thermoguttaceae bacterium]MBR5760176.1 integration host factor subunit beta [Thermoguttaceae bacterium]